MYAARKREKTCRDGAGDIACKPEDGRAGVTRTGSELAREQHTGKRLF
jgi:hypothetical protein